MLRYGTILSGFALLFTAGGAVANVSSVPAVEDICLLPPVVGDCTAAYPRYFYDACTGQCVPFIYGGCDGNANNFLTLEECEATCSPSDVCSLPADPGPCDSICPRFFHNVCTGQCEPFLFGCCDGNANNFLTLEECEATCPPVMNVCSLPGVVGPCEAIIPRFYYNPVTRRCESFIYGGCGGNANNFLTLQECEAACPMAIRGAIPTVTEWGLLVMSLLILMVGTSALAGQPPSEPICRYADDRSRLYDRNTGRKSGRSQRRR
ncbi:MAG: BPTI/Kunitz-type proteinase inhibitor domain-containing protein [Planctomycetota bacterium]|jgi:hypothetical protein